jgi:hypothetical protein
MNSPLEATPREGRSALPVAVGVGLVIGVVQAAAPFAFPSVPPATVYAMSIAFIATVYIGFAVADGRRNILVVETVVACLFIVVAALGVTESPWLLVAGFFAHGCKDLWQHRTGFVRGTRWWPPFCAAVDWVAAAILAGAVVTGWATL